MIKIIALFILLIPGIVSIFGVKLMRDALFAELFWPFPNLLSQFLIGLFMFLTGLAFVGGYIYRRDQRRNKVKRRRRLKNASS